MSIFWWIQVLKLWHEKELNHLSLPLKNKMNLKTDKISYPAIVLAILIAGLIGASINGIFGLILFFIISIPLVFLVDSFFIE